MRMTGGSTSGQNVNVQLLMDIFNNKGTLTSSSQLQFGSGLGALLIVANEALVHAFVLLLHRLDAQHCVAVTDRFAVLHPRHSLDRIAREVAREHGRTSEVHHLRGRIDFGRQRCGNGQDRFNALATHGVVDDAQVFARIFDDSVLDDQRARHLFDALVQDDRLLASGALDEFVPSVRSGLLVRLVNLSCWVCVPADRWHWVCVCSCSGEGDGERVMAASSMRGALS